MDFLGDWLAAAWGAAAAAGPWLLVGLALAGMVKQFLPEALIHRHLGRDDMRSVTWAALSGAPLPLCSCSVIPAATALRQAGASKSATTSFLIATPETGVDSVGATWALMDPLMTIVRPIAAILTALVSGGAVAALVRAGRIEAAPPPAAAATPAAACPNCAPPRLGFARRVWDGMRYGYGSLMEDLAPWLLIGFAAAGLISVLVPADFFGAAMPNGWPALLLMLVIGLPTYVCATASTPIAAALVAKGLDPGAALVFLLAGPATNVATMGVVRQFLGGRVLATYLVSIACVALLVGWAVNGLYPLLGLTPTTRVDEHALHAHGTDPLSAVSGALLLLLAVIRCRTLCRRFLAARCRTSGAP